jgi:dienelactone hydrolase
LASHGYVVLALAYFNYPGLPDRLRSIPLEYFETAIRWSQAQSYVKSNALAVVGASRGGELSLLLGSTFPEIKAVVAYLPSDVVDRGSSTPSWTWRSKPLMPKTSIAVEKTSGAVLLISATDDQAWPSTAACDKIIQRLDEAHFPFPYKHLRYVGAGHHISYPYRPTKPAIMPLLDPVSGTLSVFGGNIRDQAFANADSWPRVLQFLAANLN